MYKYVVVGSGSYEDYEGCWIFDTFKKAFDFMANMYNEDYNIWKNNGCEIYSTVKRELKNEDYLQYVGNEEDNGELYIEPLFYTIHDKCDKNGTYNVGCGWEICRKDISLGYSMS